VKDVAAAGGWKTEEVLVTSYQQADAETIRNVVFASDAQLDTGLQVLCPRLALRLRGRGCGRLTGSVENNLFARAGGQSGETWSFDAVTGLQFGPVPSRRHRDLDPPADFLQASACDPPLFGELRHRQRPHALEEFSTIHLDFSCVRLPMTNPDGLRKWKRRRFRYLDRKLLEDLS